MEINELTKDIALAVFTSLATYAINFVENNKEFIKKQYFEFISPAFELLDNYFKSNEQEFEVQVALSKLFQLSEKNKAIIGGNIRTAIYEYKKVSKDEKQEAFKQLCKIISIEHDRMCILLSIKPRTKKYKQEKGQYYTKKTFLYYPEVRKMLTLIISLLLGLAAYSLSKGILALIQLLP